jgi:serine phosphatase RsbU (regulator of sigma subunit)
MVELSNAGAPDPYLVRPGHPPQPLSVPGPRLPLGVRREVAYASRMVEMGGADGLLLLTDGLPEARDASGEPLGYEALESMLAMGPGTGSPSSRLSWLFDRVQQVTGRVPEDDWTAAVLMPREAEKAS